MRDYKVFSVAAVVGALAIMQVSVDVAWAKKAPAQAQTTSQPRQEASVPQPGNCPGGVSKGCSPGSCRCP
jgi:uncharacterized low-complexity protein